MPPARQPAAICEDIIRMNIQRSAVAAASSCGFPSWLQDLRTGLPVRSQFVVSGNIRDLYPVPGGGGLAFLPAADALRRLLEAEGYAALLVYDPVGGMRLHAGCDPACLAPLAAAGITLDTAPRDLAALAGLLGRVASLREFPVTVMLDYASQLCGGASGLDAAERDFFIACDKLAHEAAPLRAAGRPRHLPHNPLVWMVNRAGDLPGWFTVGNEAVRSLAANAPDLEERLALARTLLPRFQDAIDLTEEQRSRALEQFVLETDGMTLRSMFGVAELAEALGTGLGAISDAIRAYRIGTPSNPWKSQVMRTRILHGERLLTRRVKGQEHAVRKALDILIRSVMGLSGAQSSSRHGRPRGVLFLAGPTGVGKTELAKAITELLFGDEAAYHRFDMSEFTAENSESRLIGAPPGYAGHDESGELVNAARARPFSVFLFDEIEKAHPRILDKFLQILDEGRLTDGRGETVHFSESLIVFTSNLGIFGEDRQMNMSLNILPSDTYEEIEHKIVEAIRSHFRYKLQRPELINRIGRNIVVFEYIRAQSSALILRNMVAKVLAAVREEHGIEVVLSRTAMERIEEFCTTDLFDGGRGIGNRLETVLVNPLARLLFQRAGAGERVLRIAALDEVDGDYALRPENPAQR